MDELQTDNVGQIKWMIPICWSWLVDKVAVMHLFCPKHVYCGSNGVQVLSVEITIFVRRMVLEYRWQRTATVVRVKIVMLYVLADMSHNIDR